MVSLAPERRKVSYSILLGVWLQVAVYAVLHDQYIVRIAPEHFTEYHKPLLGITSPAKLAFVYALGASVSPGLALGLACVFVGRWGELRKIPIRRILSGVALVIVCTEVLAASLGYLVFRSGKMLFPEFLYPDPSRPMLVTQTIQLAAYLFSAIFSVLLLVVLLILRQPKPSKNK